MKVKGQNTSTKSNLKNLMVFDTSVYQSLQLQQKTEQHMQNSGKKGILQKFPYLINKLKKGKNYYMT